MSFGTISYGAAAMAFALLAGLLQSAWRGRPAGIWMLVATGATAAWAALVAWSTVRPVAGPVVYLGEALHGGIWLVALIAIGTGVIPKLLAYTALVVWAATVVIGFFDYPMLVRGGLAICILGWLMLEQIYRNAEPKSRSGLRWLVGGIGIVLAADFFLYSQAELLRGTSVGAWNARGLVYAFAVPVLAVAAKRNAQLAIDIFVSRHVVFYSATFLVAGAYLLLMAIGGYYVRAIGGTWGVTLEVAFWLIGVALLIVLLSAESLRRRLRVFIAKHFYRNKYDYRIEWLRFIRTLSSTGDGDVRRTALRAVTQIFGSPGGVLLVLDDSGRRFEPVASWPIDLDVTALGVEGIQAGLQLPVFLDKRHWIVDLEEYRHVPEVYGNMELPGWLEASDSFRIVSPMLGPDRLVGIFVLQSPPLPFELTYEDRDLLKTVGQHVAIQIAQYKADQKLAESRQFEAYNKLTAFMMHDLKNSVAQLDLIVANAERHKRNPEFVDDAISTIANAARRMAGLIDQLRGAGEVAVRVVALDELLAAAVQRCRDRVPPASMDIPVHAVWVRADSDRLGAVIEHVIRNAQDATSEIGHVSCALTTVDGSAVLAVRDSGVGMASEFVRERLFRPFDSTKGAKGMGIGAYQAREYVRMLGGDVEVQSSPGQGTTFSIRLPLSAAPAPYGVAAESAA